MLKAEGKEQLQQLQEFQSMVDDIQPRPDEVTCLRFLVAREFNLDAAEKMLRECFKWRTAIGIENYKTWNLPDDVRDEFLFDITKISYNGGPVTWVPMGRWNNRYHIEQGRREEQDRFGRYFIESVLQRMIELGKGQCVGILGMEGLTFYKVAHLETLKALYAFFQTLEKYYPEILHAVVVINAPKAFTVAYNTVRPILSARTASKFQIFNSDREKWLPALRKLMPDESIPSEYLK